MLILIDLLLYLLWAAWIVIFVQVIMSWLVGFNVVKAYNPTDRALLRALEQLTEPLYRPIRRVLPDFGGLDFSPLVVILVIGFLQRLLGSVAAQIAYGSAT